MRTHFKHHISADAELVLEEIAANRFDVIYLTREFQGSDGYPADSDGYAWFANNTQTFTNFNEAKVCFNKRRASDNPFYVVKL